jgi:glycosyltransferase involved in cell wall biosynthesis
MNIALVNDHFRLVQTDQLSALAKALDGESAVVGIEIYSSTDPEYPFGSWTGEGFTHEQVFKEDARGKHGILAAALSIVRICRRHNASVVLLCHYERPYIFLAALMLRALGRRVIVMGDSKFDDYPRHFWRELGKRLLYAPYHGAIAGSARCADYQRFLGVPAKSIYQNYNAFNLNRIRAAADHAPAPLSDIKFEDRNFVCVARHVPKKNLSVLIKAFWLFLQQSSHSRKLVLCGSGPLEDELRTQVDNLGLNDSVVFKGNVGPNEVAVELARGLCLILPSIEEQYGIAIVEAQAMGLPVIVSTSCGARDRQVRSGVNGFIVEPDNPEGFGHFMLQIATNELQWSAMSKAAHEFADFGNVDKFVESVLLLMRR